MAGRGDIVNTNVQPELFESWLKLNFKESLGKSGAFTKLKSKDYSESGLYPVIDQGEKFISGFVNDEALLYKGDLPIIIFGDHTRVVKFVDFPFAVGADGTKILNPLEVFDKRFYYYYFKSLNIPSLGYSRHYKILSDINFPLPPLPEQKRIVAKLDSLFERLEKVKARMERVPELMKRFREAVLNQAVSGKLTEDWRVGNSLNKNNLPDNWSTLNIENLVRSLKTDLRTGPFGSALKKSEHQLTGIPVWGIESIGRNGFFTGQNKIYVTEAKAKELKSFSISGGDIIISRSGTVGEMCILPLDVPYGLISTNLMKIILDKNVILPKYFCWLFRGSHIIINKLQELCKGSTRLFLTQMILKKLTFTIPPIAEQTEIVTRVESLFRKADKIESQYEVLKAKLEGLPQAILAKAFKGELVEQLETDGDARALLEEIRKLKIEN